MGFAGLKAEDIKSADDLGAWLNGLPKDQISQVAPQIAHRAAMRVLPVWAAYWSNFENEIISGVSVFRCHLLCAVALHDRNADFDYELFKAKSVWQPAASHALTSFKHVSSRDHQHALSEVSAYIAKAARQAAEHAGHAVSIVRRTYRREANIIFSAAKLGAAESALTADIVAWESGKTVSDRPLFLPDNDVMQRTWTEAAPLFERHPAWAVFKELYENTLHARPQNWPLLTALAQKDEAFWTGKDEEVLDRIAGVMEAFEPAEKADYRLDQDTRLTAASLMRAAIADFKLDDIRHLLEMVPFPEDVEQFSDPADLASFLSEADGLMRSMETLQVAFEREGRAMQGAGSMFVYLDAILEELSSVRQTSSLNVGWVIECGDILQGYSLNADIVAEIGALNMPLRHVVERLSKLIAGHFASTLLRFAALRDIKSSEDTSLADFMEDLRRGLEVIADTSRNSRIPLAPEAIEVFEKLLAAVEKTIKAEFLAPDTKTKGSLRKEADFLIAQVMVSMMLYWEKAKSRSRQTVTVADELGKIGRGVNGLETLWRLFRDIFFP